jgi:usherin
MPPPPLGVITQYRLFQNGLLIYNNPTTREFRIGNLLPWSLHLLRVEACTVKGCGSTTEVSARTQEAPPVGTIGLDLIVEGPRSVRLLWNGVVQSNGVVQYDAYFEGLFYVDPGELKTRDLFTTNF